MPTYTSYFNLAKPTVNDPVDSDQWGGLLNSDIDAIDGLLRGVTSAKSASFTVQTTEFGQIYLCNATSAAIVATLPSAATAGNGFKVAFKKTDSSANAVTLTPNGSDTIDGAATYALTTQYSSVVVVSNGSVWSVISGGGDMKATIRANESYTFLGSYTASSSASINITSKITSEFDTYFIEIQDLIPATDNTSLWLRTSTNNGTSWDTGASDYSYVITAVGSASATTFVTNAATDNAVVVSPALGNAAGRSFDSTVKLYNPLNSSLYTNIRADNIYTATNGQIALATASGRRTSAAAVNAIQFLMSSGNIASGIVRVYGLRKV